MRAIPQARMTLCDALDELSEATWLEIEQGSRTRQRLEEESITSYDLMRLAAAVPSVALEKHTKKREWKSGADWEIWAGKPGGFLGLRVQAKILDCDSPSPTYKSLYASKSKATVQVDKLIKGAETAPRRMFPVLAFYNSTRYSSNHFAAMACPRLAARPLLCGWTLASAYAVRARLLYNPTKHLRDLADLMVPVSCLFCCPSDCPALGSRRSSLASDLSEQVQRAWPDDAPSGHELVHPTAPVYIERLYKGERAETGWRGVPAFLRSVLADGRELPAGVSRVLLIRDVAANDPDAKVV